MSRVHTPHLAKHEAGGWPASCVGVYLDGEGHTFEAATNKIEQWDDQSGAGNHATQSVSGSKPLWDSGNHWIEGHSSGTWLELSSAILPTAAGGGFIIGGRITTPLTNGANDNVGFFTQWSGSDSARYFFRFNAITGNFHHQSAGNELCNVAGSLNTEYAVVAYKDGSDWGVAIDGGGYTTATLSRGIQNTPTHLGGDSGFTSSWHDNDRIHDLIICDTYNATDRDAIMDMLVDRKGT